MKLALVAALLLLLGVLALLCIPGRDAWGRDYPEVTREPVGKVVPCAATPGQFYRGLCIDDATPIPVPTGDVHP